MVNAKLREGKIRVGFEIDPAIYVRWQDSGMNQAYVFMSGLDVGEMRSKVNVLADLLDKADTEINKKNEKVYFLGERLRECNEKLTQVQCELIAAKEKLEAAGIKFIYEIEPQPPQGE